MTDLAATNPEPAPEPALAPEVAPVEPAVEPVEPEGVEPALEAETPGPDQPVVQPDPDDLLATPDADTVEVEVGGLKYRVPAALRDGYLRNADYTTKTQEVADKGRALETEREAFTQHAQAHRDNIADFGELAHADKLLESFRKVDFPELQQTDADQAQQLSYQYQKLRDEREQIVGRINQREHEQRVTAERDHANRKDQLKATLARDIPGYSPEVHQKMVDVAEAHGISKERVNSITDPAYMQILYEASLGRQVLERKRAATAQPAPAVAKPVPKVQGGKTPTGGPQDKQTTADWMSSREQQLRKSLA